MSDSNVDGRTQRRQRSRRRMLDATERICEESGDTGFTLSEVAEAAGVTRQTVYQHFGSKGGLLLELVDHIDRRNELGTAIAEVFSAGTAKAAVVGYFELTAEYTPLILPIAKAIDQNRRTDPDAAAAWDDRMAGRLRSCTRLAERLTREHTLREGWTTETAADLIYSATSVQGWELLVEERGWAPHEWASRNAELVLKALVED